MMPFETFRERLREIVDLQLAGRSTCVHEAVARLRTIDRKAESVSAAARSGKEAVSQSVGIAQTDEQALYEIEVIDRELARLFKSAA